MFGLFRREIMLRQIVVHSVRSPCAVGTFCICRIVSFGMQNGNAHYAVIINIWVEHRCNKPKRWWLEGVLAWETHFCM